MMESTVIGGGQAPYSAAWYESLKQTLGVAGCRQLGFYEIPADLLLSVVIPIYNEQETIRDVIERVSSVPIRKELILVDDCSSDGSREILKEWEQRADEDPNNAISVAYHDENRGKGAALRTGFERATGDIIIIQDHLPKMFIVVNLVRIWREMSCGRR